MEVKQYELGKPQHAAPSRSTKSWALSESASTRRAIRSAARSAGDTRRFSVRSTTGRGGIRAIMENLIWLIPIR
jgi:hypothetical protein